MSIPSGYVLIKTRRTRETARAALDAATAIGKPTSVVKAVQDGFLVPRGAEDHYVDPLATEAPEEEPQDESEDGPDETWKNADIETYAIEHGVDLEGATKKAEMLAAIAAAQKES